MNDDKPQRHLRPLEGNTEQETQCRYGPIDGCRPNGALMLIDLKTPEVFDCGGIGRLAEKSCKAPNVADVVLLRVRPKTADLHILQHPLAERGCRGSGSDNIHGRFLFVEGTPRSRADTAPLKASIYYATSPQATLPRSGSSNRPAVKTYISRHSLNQYFSVSCRGQGRLRGRYEFDRRRMDSVSEIFLCS